MACPQVRELANTDIALDKLRQKRPLTKGRLEKAAALVFTWTVKVGSPLFTLVSLFVLRSTPQCPPRRRRLGDAPPVRQECEAERNVRTP